MLFVLKNLWFRIKSFLLERFNFINCFLSVLFAYFSSFAIYKLLYPVCTYKSLDDFYVGTSIYCNHNKYLDIGIVFVYLILFYVFYSIINFKEFKFKINICRLQKPIYIFSIVIAVLLCFSFRFDINGLVIPDPHHYGEKFATYWLHIKYGMQYYIDIMLVHGYLDVFPSFLADKFCGELNFINDQMMVNVFSICLLAFNLLLAIFIFKKRLLTSLLASSMICYILHVNNGVNIYNSAHITTFILVYILLLKNINTRFVFCWNFAFLLISAFVMTYQTTLGTACVFASLPLLISHFKRNIKQDLIFWSITFVLIMLYFHESITAYFTISQYYISSNLYSFGNKFPRQFSLISFITFSFFLIPVLLIPIIANLALLKKNKEITYLVVFWILFVIVTLNYSFGRIDSTAKLPRMQGIFWAVVATLIPYLILKIKKEYLDIYSILLTIFIYIYSLSNFVIMPRFFVAGPSDNKITNSQIAFINSTVDEHETVLDLTNNGMFYYYVNRKIAIPNTSFFNIVNTKQTEDILEKLKLNPPKLVRINNLNEICYFHDKVRIPERINKIYRWLFLSGLYEQRNIAGVLYLVYNPNSSKILVDDIDTLGVQDLEYLPDAWGASIKTLPLVKLNDSLKIDNSKIQVDESITPKDADLLFLDISCAPDSDLELKMNNLKSTLKFKTQTNKLLIPIDSYPTWLMSDKVESFELLSKDNIKINKAVLYKRK